MNAAFFREKCHPRRSEAAAFQTAAAPETMSEMIGWAYDLLDDMETMAKFVGRKPLI